MDIKHFLNSFTFTADIPRSLLHIVYIPTSERVGEIRISGNVNWDRLAELLLKKPNAIQINFSFTPVRCVIIDLTDNAIIGEGNVDININLFMLFRILLDNLSGIKQKTG